MTYRTGHIPDHSEVVKSRISIQWHPKIRAFKNTALPENTANTDKLAISAGGPGIRNQSDLGACEGYGNSSGINLYLACQGKQIPVISALGFYYGALLVSNTPNPDGSLPQLFDTGTTPNAIQQAFGLWGAVAETTWGQLPVGSATTYLDPSNPNSTLIPPTPEQLFGESLLKFKGGYFVTSTGNQKILDVLTALAAGIPLTNAIPASGSQFQNYSGGVLGALSGPVDHCNLIGDYRWTGTASQWVDYLAALKTGDNTIVSQLDSYLNLIGINSWGTGWGESDAPDIAGGMYRGNRAYADQMESVCALDVEIVT